MKVAVTGISGYLGSLLARLLDADPSVTSILGLDIAPPALQSEKLDFRRADVLTADFPTILEGIDALYHMAFVVEPAKNLTMPQIDRINIEGSAKVFEGAAAAGVPKIVYSSSVSAYGAHPDNPEPLSEDSPLRPNEGWYYSRTKGKVEAFLDAFERQHPSIIVIRFRPCTFFGSSINNSMGDLFSGRVLFCLDRNIKMDLCWDEDIAEAFRMALRHGRSDVFNLAAKGPLTMDEAGAILGRRVVHLRKSWLLPLARAAASMRILPQWQLEWVDEALSGSMVVSADRARERLGWRPRLDSRQVLIRYAGRPRTIKKPANVRS